MEPTTGRIVHYRLSADDCKRIEERRADTAFTGNQPRPGDVVPLLIVRVWPDEYTGSDGKVGHYGPDGEIEWVQTKSRFGVNGQAFLDGNDSLWVTSAAHADGAGCWDWPPRV